MKELTFTVANVQQNKITDLLDINVRAWQLLQLALYPLNKEAPLNSKVNLEVWINGDLRECLQTEIPYADNLQDGVSLAKHFIEMHCDSFGYEDLEEIKAEQEEDIAILGLQTATIKLVLKFVK
jgi:hypothetical protein